MSSETVPGPTASDTHSPDGSVPASSPETWTPEQVAEMKLAIARGMDAQDRYIRLYADFENFKKRAQRERDDVRRSAVEGVIARILPVVDNFDMAMAAAHQPGTTTETLVAGVGMIQSQVRGILEEFGIDEIVAVGQPFDPSLHEAVSQLEVADVPEGQVVQQVRKGYRCRDRLLRPAMVIVAGAPVTPDDGRAAS